MRSLKVFLSLCIVAMAVGITPASDYVLRSDGFYYLSDVPHTRVATLVNGYYYWSHCCRYWQPEYYSYSYVRVNISPKPPAYGPGWKEEYVKYLQALKDHEEFRAAMQAIGPKFDYSTSSRFLGVAGTSTYGYQQSTLSLSAPVDANVMMQQATSLVRQAGELFGKGTQEHKELTELQLSAMNTQTQLKILGDVAVALAQNQPAVLKIANQEFKIDRDVSGQAKIEPVNVKPEFIMQQHCASCHGDDKTKNKSKFFASTWPQLSEQDRRDIVIGRILSRDDSVRMPKAPHAPLPKTLAMQLLPGN